MTSRLPSRVSPGDAPNHPADERGLARLGAQLRPHWRIHRAPGGGRTPVVIQMHGCGGVQPMQAHYAERAQRLGVSVMVLDSLAPRGIGRRRAQATVCTGLRLRGAERARDLLAALQWLEAQSWVDASRIAAAGWSHGAWAIMEALAEPALPPASRRRVSALKAVFLVYPYAGPLSRTAKLGWGKNRPDVYACLAGRDAVVGQAGPRRALARLAADRLKVQTLELPTGTHAFDDEGAEDPRSRYDRALTLMCEDFYVRCLSGSLGLPLDERVQP
jgi:dienelactone hydrolase